MRTSGSIQPPPADRAGPRFDLDLAPDGYAWWYVDGLSADGRHGLTVIASLGSVFSPYYAWARNRGPADPLDHCSLNVALYGSELRRWSMTERGRSRIARAGDHVEFAGSSVHWDGTALHVRIDERCAPLPQRLRGTVRVWPEALHPEAYVLDAAGRHCWTPYAPRARLEVDFERPRLHWRGDAYLDANSGSEPLERGFRRWHWSRAAGARRTVVLYDRDLRDGTRRQLGLAFDADGRARELDPPRDVALPATGWRIERRTRADAGAEARVVRTFTDAPFYCRSQLATTLDGEAMHAIHETADLDRFASRWVQCLLPFRMPRIA